MPKIIFTLQYMRDAQPAKLENYVKFIDTREGLEVTNRSRPRVKRIGEQGLFNLKVRKILSSTGILGRLFFILNGHYVTCCAGSIKGLVNISNLARSDSFR